MSRDTDDDGMHELRATAQSLETLEGFTGVDHGSAEARLAVAHVMIIKLREALLPFAFLDAKNIRWVWTHNPEVLTGTGGRESFDHNADFKGQCVGIVSGPWMSHTETPDLDRAVRKARHVLGLSRASQSDESQAAPDPDKDPSNAE